MDYFIGICGLEPQLLAMFFRIFPMAHLSSA